MLARNGGIPVLAVRLAKGAVPEVPFYFVEPPSMIGKQAKMTLVIANSFMKDEVAEREAALHRMP